MRNKIYVVQCCRLRRRHFGQHDTGDWSRCEIVPNRFLVSRLEILGQEG